MEEDIDEVVTKLSYEIVKEIAPDELDLFEDFREEFKNNPEAFLAKDSKRKEDKLGFAVEAAVGTFTTSYVLPILTDVFTKYLGDTARVKLKGEKIPEMREYTLKNAITLGMNEDKAELFADALMFKLKQSGYT